MSRFIASLILCLLPLGSGFLFAEVDSLEELRLKIENLTEAPYAGTAEDDPAHLAAIGEEILSLVEPFMNQADLTDENKKFLADRKLLGLQLRYALDEEEYEKKYGEFLEAAQDYDLYRKWISQQFYDAYRSYYYADKAKQVEVFLPLVDRLAPLINKYFDDEKRNSNEQLPSIIVSRAQTIDPDGSRGVVRVAVEKLRPVLEADAKRSDFLLKVCALRVLNATRLFDMVGKPIEFAPLDLDRKPIDLNAMKGKVVLVVPAPYRWGEQKLVPLGKLAKTLKPHGLEIILFSDDDPEIAREKLLSKGETWIVASRYGGSSGNRIDLTEHFGSHSFSFVIDREGIVTCARTDYISPEHCEALKPLFPEQVEQLTEIADEIRAVDKEIQRESEELDKKYQMESDEKLPETLQNLVDIRKKISLTAPAEMQLVFSDLFLADENLPTSMRSGMLRGKVEILGELARKAVKANPEMRPETAFEDVCALVDELLATEDPVFHHNLIFAKQEALYHMREYLETMESGQEEYAEEITRRFLVITKQVPETFYHNTSSFIMFYRSTLEDIDAKHGTQLARSFINQVIPLLEEKEGIEYKQEAKRLEGIKRRLDLMGSEMEFETVLLDGSKINVKDLRGKVVVVNFWATTCGPCLREFPHMKTLYEKYKSQGYEMIAYSCGDDEETLKNFVEKHDYPWLFGSMLKSIDAEMTNYDTFYGITGIPTTIILDRSGKVRFMMVGSDDELFTRELEKRFAEEPE